MGWQLGLVLTNTIIIELGSTIVKELVNKSLIELYVRCVDDTLLLVIETISILYTNI